MHRDSPWNTSTVRQEIEEFLPLVRFLTLTTDEFVECVLPSNVFTSREGIKILMKIKGVPGSVLPEVAPCELTVRLPQETEESRSDEDAAVNLAMPAAALRRPLRKRSAKPNSTMWKY